ncbi:MAG: hypothetical protein ACC656_02130 [Candidatus Heimdallarchaeota archaeon]
MSIVSASQFKELVESAIYSPRRDRDKVGGVSAELYEGVGDRISNLRVKFYIEDDGGEWNSDLLQPELNWDMKNVIAQSVADSGGANLNVSLNANNVRETDDGIEFFESTNSRLYSESFSTSSLDFTKFACSIWFTPEKLTGTEHANIVSLGDGSSVPNFSISIDPNPNYAEQFMLRIYMKLSSATQAYQFTQTTEPNSTQWDWGNKFHLVVRIESTIVKVILNGETYRDVTTPGGGNLSFGSNSDVIVGSGYRGEISYCSVRCGASSVTDTHLENFWKHKYPLPRGPELVDLSEYFEQDGRDLLLDVGNISKAIENLKGQLYVKSNTIKVRN